MRSAWSEWEAFLAARLGRRVVVAAGGARSAPIRAVAVPGGFRVRLHPMFEAAPPGVREDVAAWLRSGRRARAACERLGAYIRTRLPDHPRPPKRKPRLEPRGRVHDLGAIASSLFETEFRADFARDRLPAITWGRRSRSRARGSLTLGSFDPATLTVRVHPVLDDAAVPAWFVRFILFHEILHAVLPGVPHGAPAFRARHEAYPDLDRAVAYERASIRGLIRRARAYTCEPRGVRRDPVPRLPL